MTDPSLRPAERLFVAVQHLLPQHLLSALMYRVARWRWRPFKDALIGWFVRHFRVDMSLAAEPDPRAYATFNAFFTRALRPGVRLLAPDPGALLCPADGALSQIGLIRDGALLQAKGHSYTALDLLGGDAQAAAAFAGGAFATIYLSPRDYHRVHMPVEGVLRAMTQVSGRLFSVNAVTARGVPRLFARNERVICLFDTPVGPMALILVGAIFVGCMETVWAGQVAPPLRGGPRPDAAGPVRLGRGEEMGRFNMGSTVILLLPPGAVAWDSGLKPGDPLRMGQALGELKLGAEGSGGRLTGDGQRPVSASVRATKAGARRPCGPASAGSIGCKPWC
jgi:phosphatidylserine decarboxylase